MSKVNLNRRGNLSVVLLVVLILALVGFALFSFLTYTAKVGKNAEIFNFVEEAVVAEEKVDALNSMSFLSSEIVANVDRVEVSPSGDSFIFRNNQTKTSGWWFNKRTEKVTEIFYEFKP